MKFNDRSMALLGIPDLPPRAFIRKAGGGIIPQGGGGSSPTQTQTSDMPEWAKPYAQEVLAKQSALGDVPYQAYGGNRIQGFTPMEETARQNAAGMGTSNITGQVAQRGLNTQNFGADQASQYMNPYMQNVVDIQKREAQRQSGIQGTQQAGQATSSGALGGSRDAIMRAERERNLGTQMNDIQSVGSNAAYTNAQNQFNADQNRGLQGLNIAATAGQQQFQQGMDINKLQGAYGAQQRAMGQQGLDLAYQDFQNQKNYPQQQLDRMTGTLRGVPIGSTQTTTGTPGSPSNLQMLGGLAQIGTGLSRFFADGGSVDSEQNIESIVHKLTDQQLAQAEQAAKARGDVVQMQAIATEKAARASMQRGIGAAPVDMDQMLPTEESMARGGIVSFGFGGSAYGDEDEGEDEAQNYMNTTKNMDGGGGDDAGYPKDIAGSISALQGLKYKAPTPEERAASFEANRALMMKGVDTTDREGIRADIKRMQEENDTNLKRGQGLALIQSGAAMFEGNDFGRAASRSASTFAQAYSGAMQANQAKNNALANMKQNLAESQRKEQMGLNREAIALQDQARKDGDAAQKFEVDRTRALGVLYAAKARAERVPAVKPPAPLKLNEQLAEAEITAANNPTDKDAQTRVRALRSAVSQTKSSFTVADIGGNRLGVEENKAAAAATAGENKTNAGITAEVERRALLDPEYQQALSKGDTGGMKTAKDRMYTEIQNRQKPAAKPATTPTPANDFDAKWAKLKSGQSLVGPDGKTYTKK